MESLKYKFKEVAEAYLKAFCEKHDYDYENDSWIGGRVGEVAVLGDDFYDLNDIRYDIDNNIPAGEIEKWTAYFLRLEELECPKKINFQSWCKGAPLPYSEDMLNNIEDARERVKEAKKELESLLKDETSF